MLEVSGTLEPNARACCIVCSVFAASVPQLPLGNVSERNLPLGTCDFSAVDQSPCAVPSR